MYIAAITRWGNPMEKELPALEKITGVQIYDLRLRLAGQLPVIVAQFQDAASANQLMGQLRKRGHGAVAFDSNRILRFDTVFTPKSFELTDQAIHLSSSGNIVKTIIYEDIFALIHAQLEYSEQNTTVTREKKFSVGRAVVTGGLMSRKTVEKEEVNRQHEYEQVLYIVCQGGKNPVLMRQYHLNYSGLGKNKGYSSMESFSNLVKFFQQQAPSALYDNRLLLSRRKSSIHGFEKNRASGQTATVIGSSNVFETELAAHLILLAHYHGQL